MTLFPHDRPKGLFPLPHAPAFGVDHLDDSDEDTDNIHSEIVDTSPSGDDT